MIDLLESYYKKLEEQSLNESEMATYNYDGKNFGLVYTYWNDFAYGEYKGYFSGRTEKHYYCSTPEEALSVFHSAVKRLDDYASVQLGFFNNGDFYPGESFSFFAVVTNPNILQVERFNGFVNGVGKNPSVADIKSHNQSEIQKANTEYIDWANHYYKHRNDPW